MSIVQDKGCVSGALGIECWSDPLFRRGSLLEFLITSSCNLLSFRAQYLSAFLSHGVKIAG